MRNIRLVVTYDGTDFQGWQWQASAPTVQSCLETTIERVVGEQVWVWGSGRTDAGVHALNQVANFKTNSPIPCEGLRRALNDLLPPTVRVKEASEVSEAFHARYDARSKTYRYRILQAPICSPFIWRFVCHYPYLLDHKRMAEAARLIEGEHDFTSFAGIANVGAQGRRPGADAVRPYVQPIGAQVEGAVRDPPLRFPEGLEVATGSVPEVGQTHRSALTSLAGLQGERAVREPPLQAAEGVNADGEDDSEASASPHRPDKTIRKIFSSRLLWRPRASILIYEVRGSGFLHHMVRNIVGTLMEVGRGKLEPQDMTRILEARDRAQAGPTAQARGLCLVKVEY